MADRVYSKEETDAILARAIELAWGTGLASHLLAVALVDEPTLRQRLARQRERENLRAAALGVTARALGHEPRAGRVRVEALGEDHAEPGEGEAEAELEQPPEKGSRRRR